MLSQLSPTKGVKGDPRGLQCMSIFPSPHPLSSRKLKKALKLPSHRYLPTANISFSPSSLHFRPDFSLLPTFSGHFSLLPIVYLPPHKCFLMRIQLCTCTNFIIFFFKTNTSERHTATYFFLLFRLSFRNYKSCVYNCDDLPSYNYSTRSSHI